MQVFLHVFASGSLNYEASYIGSESILVIHFIRALEWSPTAIYQLLRMEEVLVLNISAVKCLIDSVCTHECIQITSFARYVVQWWHL